MSTDVWRTNKHGGCVCTNVDLVFLFFFFFLDNVEKLQYVNRKLVFSSEVRWIRGGRGAVLRGFETERCPWLAVDPLAEAEQRFRSLLGR